MKPTAILVVYAWIALTALAAAWSKEDYEIFRLRDEVALHEGPEVTFYDFLGVKPSASQLELSKALKKKSRTLHPDKIKQQFITARSTAKPKKKGDKKSPGVHVSKGPSEREVKTAYKQANERYARLAVVAKILQSENRERYDYFLAHGFPKWRGTGYYYARFRPGLGSVLVGLFLALGGGAHYGALVLGWKRQRDFIDRYIRQARRTAWGDETGIRGIPGVNGNTAPAHAAPEEPDSMMQMNRRQKRQLEKESKKEKPGKGKTAGKTSGTQIPVRDDAGPTGEKKRVVADNGKILIVDSIGNVYLEEEDEDGNIQDFLLDPSEIARPTVKDTALYKVPRWIYHRCTVRFRTPAESPPQHDEGPAIVISDSSPEQDPRSSFEVIGSDSPADNMAQANGDGNGNAAAKRRAKKGKN